VPEKFYLQAGAFEDPSEADNLKARLALMGVEASVQKVDVPEKGTMHRVRVGPYMGQEAMSKARAAHRQRHRHRHRQDQAEGTKPAPAPQ
jgi:cell division protein FtsN